MLTPSLPNFFRLLTVASTVRSHSGWLFEKNALAAHDFGAQTPVKQIGRFAVAVYARCVGHEDADVVEHGGAVQKLAVEMQFGMAVGHSEGFSGHLAAMVKQQAAQFVVGGIVLADDFFSSH